MIRVMGQMPIGTIGFEATGKVTKEDYEDGAGPRCHGGVGAGPRSAAVRARRGLRVLLTGRHVVRHETVGGPPESWERVAVVTDVDWVENGIKAFSWLMHGKIKVFDEDDVDKAKLWLVTPDEE